MFLPQGNTQQELNNKDVFAVIYVIGDYHLVKCLHELKSMLCCLTDLILVVGGGNSIDLLLACKDEQCMLL